MCVYVSAWPTQVPRPSLDARPLRTATNTGHSYPTSAKQKKNWDAIAAEVQKEEDQPEDDKDPNAGGDAALNKVFQKLYANATDDQKRAMIKSYQESNGTSLSTSWDEVKKG